MDNNKMSKPNNNYALLLKVIKQLLFKNLAFKILAIILALAFWAGLVSQAPNITREKKFNDIQVNIVGLESLKRNGLIVVDDLSKNPPTVSFSADVPQMQYQNAKAQNYMPKIDLSEITEPGINTLPISCNSTILYGSVSNITPSTLDVEVDKYITQYRIPVQFEKKGDFNKGFYCTEPYLDPLTINVSGPARSIKNIAKAIVTVDVSKYPRKEGIIKTSARFKLVDMDEKEIKDNQIEITSDSINVKNILVTQHQYAMKSFMINAKGLLQGTVKDGYYIDRISISPSVVFVAGNKDLIDNIKNIYVNDLIDVTDRQRTLTKTLKLNIPSEVVYTSARTVIADIEIKPIISEKTYKNIPIHIVGKKEGYSYALDTKYIDLSLRDEANKLAKIRENNIEVYLDVSNLGLGIHSALLKVKINSPGIITNKLTYTYLPENIKIRVEAE